MDALPWIQNQPPGASPRLQHGLCTAVESSELNRLLDLDVAKFREPLILIRSNMGGAVSSGFMHYLRSPWTLSLSSEEGRLALYVRLGIVDPLQQEAARKNLLVFCSGCSKSSFPRPLSPSDFLLELLLGQLVVVLYGTIGLGLLVLTTSSQILFFRTMRKDTCPSHLMLKLLLLLLASTRNGTDVSWLESL